MQSVVFLPDRYERALIQILLDTAVLVVAPNEVADAFVSAKVMVLVATMIGFFMLGFL